MNNKILKFILVTGASGKIGMVLCRELIRCGYGVIGLVHREESRALLAKDFSKEVDLGQMILLQCNLCVEDERKSLLANLAELNIQLYGLINNARSLTNLASDSNGYIGQENFLNEFLLGVYVAYDLSFQLAQTAGLKRIINVSSIYGIVATTPNLYTNENQRPPVHYGVAKSALIHLTKELSTRFAAQEITVNAVSFGGVEGRVDKEFLSKYEMLCPQKRMLKESDLAGGIIFLLSSQADAVNGHNLVTDGGWTVW